MVKILLLANTPANLRKVHPSPSKNIARKIATNAEKVLDAPAYIDDYCELKWVSIIQSRVDHYNGKLRKYFIV